MLIQIIVTLVVVGVLLYLVNSLVPMPAWVKQLINVLAGLGVFIWLLEILGFLGSRHDVFIR